MEFERIPLTDANSGHTMCLNNTLSTFILSLNANWQYIFGKKPDKHTQTHNYLN